MIVSRAPVRFSLGGGGTDLPSYCDEHGGFLVAASIDKYIYVGANSRFYDDILLKYSHTERVDVVPLERAPRVQARVRVDRAACAGGVLDRDRPPQGAHRQAGSVHQR